MSSAKQVPLISVIVPVYNVQRYLRECLDSLARQSDTAYEVVIIDDGSTDDSYKIIDEYCEKYSHFWSHRQKNLGLGGARNTGIRICHGEFVTFVDSDDYVSDDYVESLRAEQARGDHDMVSGGFLRISEGGEILKQQKFPLHQLPSDFSDLQPYQLLLGSYVPSVCWARLYRKRLFAEHPLQFFDKMPHEDLCFTYKAAYFARTLSEFPRSIYYYRQRPGTLSKVASFEHVDGVIEQWHDTEKMLDSVNAPDIDRTLAARRTLNLLQGVKKRSLQAPQEVQRYLGIKVTSHIERIRGLVARALSLPLEDTYDPTPIEQLIRELEMSNNGMEAGNNADANSSSNLIFPHNHINLTKYPQNDQENDPPADSEKVSEFYNKFKGRRCFIIGNGPSLNKHDLSLLEGEYTFAVNSIFYKTNETGFRPTFFVVEDSKVMEERIENIREYDAPYKFFPSKYREMIGSYNKNTIFYRCDWGFYRKSSPFYCVPRFSVDASNVVYAGQTVTYANMQLAFFMGFTEVYLIGMDFDYVIPVEHERRGNHIISTTDDPNHFHKDYFGKGKTWKDPKLERVAMSYRQARLSFEAVGRNIYNATIGGQLEIFERVDYEKLLRDPATGKKREKAIAPVPIAPAKAKAVPQSGTAHGSDTVGKEPAADQAKRAEREASSPAGKKWAKFRRNPKAFFRDSRVLPLRPLQYLFPRSSRTKDEVEARRQARQAAGGFFSFLPASRKALAAERAEVRAVAHRAEARLRHELARLNKDAKREEMKWRKSEAQLQAELNKLREESEKNNEALSVDLGTTRSALRSELDETLVKKTLALEERMKAIASAANAALRADMARGLQAGYDSDVALNLNMEQLQQETRANLEAMREDLEEKFEQELAGRVSELLANFASLEAQISSQTEEIQSLREKTGDLEQSAQSDIQALRLGVDQRLHAEVSEQVKTLQAELQSDLIQSSEVHELARTEMEALEKRIEEARAEAAVWQRKVDDHAKNVSFLRKRVATSERQIGSLRYPDAPATLVFFGHHKCGSRFFRDQVFPIAAEATGARVRRYQIQNPPFHYSMSDDLDLCNMDFSELGINGRDIVLFSNATERSLARINRETKDWKGLRILRDPRQVLVSNYFHHKGDHHTEFNGWIWDQLARDKPILHKLDEEAGLLYELDSISKQIIETQILAPFDDDRIMAVKIEDLSEDPEGHFQKMSEFLGVPDIAGLDFSRTYANPDSGSWENHFTSELRDVFKERYGQALIDLGYAEDLDW